MTEESASINNMYGTNTAVDIFREIEKFLLQYNLKWKKLRCISTDEGKNMCGAVKGLVGQTFKIAETAGCSKFMFLHCMIHQQALCGKYLDLSRVIESVNGGLHSHSSTCSCGYPSSFLGWRNGMKGFYRFVPQT